VSKDSVRKNGRTFTILLVPRYVLERELLLLASEKVRWKIIEDGERRVLTLEGASGKELDAVLRGLMQRFGPKLMRKGDSDYASELVASLIKTGVTVACAESCTGGLVSKLITDVPGSSEIFWGGFITYSNSAKTDLLGVPEKTLDTYGAVSMETVRAMCRGTLKKSGAGCAVAVSGVAGPGGGSPEKPVGTVWIGVQRRDGLFGSAKFQFRGSRERVRILSAYASLFMVESVLCGECLDTDLPFDYI
jgi:PncC family amidohydrolase